MHSTVGRVNEILDSKKNVFIHLIQRIQQTTVAQLRKPHEKKTILPALKLVKSTLSLR